MPATEFLITFDTTNNLYSIMKCFEEEISAYLKQLFGPEHLQLYRMAIITHGGYTDDRHVYTLRLTNKLFRIKTFISRRKQSKGDPKGERSYELVIRESNRINWHRPSRKIMIMVGNGIPHKPEFSSPIIDWRVELNKLIQRGITIYTVHMENIKNDDSRHFFQEVADKSNGFYFNLRQYRSFIPWLDMFLYTLVNDGNIDKDLFNEVPLEVEYNLRRWLKLYPLKPPPPLVTGLQVLDVIRQTNIKRFIKEYRIIKPKQVFYELTEPTVIKPFKDVILYSPRTGEIIQGYQARNSAGISCDEVCNYIPPKPQDSMWSVFYEPSTHAQKLYPGTRFIWRENLLPSAGDFIEYG